MTTGEVKFRQVIVMKSGDTRIPVSARLNKPVGGPLDGEITEDITYDVRDMFNTVISADKPPVVCANKNTVLDHSNGFQCDKCRRNLSVVYMTKALEDDESAPRDKDLPRLGICDECWKKSRMTRILKAIGSGLLTILRVIAAPYMTPRPSPISPSASGTGKLPPGKPKGELSLR